MWNPQIKICLHYSYGLSKTPFQAVGTGLGSSQGVPYKDLGNGARGTHSCHWILILPSPAASTEDAPKIAKSAFDIMP